MMAMRKTKMPVFPTASPPVVVILSKDLAWKRARRVMRNAMMAMKRSPMAACPTARLLVVETVLFAPTYNRDSLITRNAMTATWLPAMPA
jgi:hypothetical protein